MRTVKRPQASYTYYTPEEAEELGLTVLADWKAGVPGDWVLTDDGWVAPVVRAGAFKRSSSKDKRWVGIPTGTFLADQGYIDGVMRDQPTSFSGKSRALKDPDRPLTKVEKQFLGLFLDSWDAETAAKKMHPDKDRHTIQKVVSVYSRRANVRRVLRDALEVRLKGTGLSREWFGEQLKASVEKADRTQDSLRGLELAAKVLELVDSSTTKVETQTFLGVSAQEVQQISTERREALGRELPGGETETPEGDETGHGAVREVDVPEGPLKDDTLLP